MTWAQEDAIKRAQDAFVEHLKWADTLDDETPKFTESDILDVWCAAIESTGEGWNGEWGYSDEATKIGVTAWLKEKAR